MTTVTDLADEVVVLVVVVVFVVVVVVVMVVVDVVVEDVWVELELVVGATEELVLLELLLEIQPAATTLNKRTAKIKTVGITRLIHGTSYSVFHWVGLLLVYLYFSILNVHSNRSYLDIIANSWIYLRVTAVILTAIFKNFLYHDDATLKLECLYTESKNK